MNSELTVAYNFLISLYTEIQLVLCSELDQINAWGSNLPLEICGLGKSPERNL